MENKESEEVYGAYTKVQNLKIQAVELALRANVSTTIYTLITNATEIYGFIKE